MNNLSIFAICFFSILILQVQAQAQAPIVLKDINSDNKSSNPIDLIVANDLAFFYADDGIHGYELWKTDGTETGTALVKDIVSGAESSLPPNEYSFQTNFKRGIFNDLLYFLVLEEDESTLSLWRSNGSEAGTFQLKEIAVDFGKLNSRSGEFVIWDNEFFFSVNNELWKSDGTEMGTEKLEIFEANIYNLISDGESLFFDRSRYSIPGQQTSSYYVELLKSDGVHPAEYVSQLSIGSPGLCGVSLNGRMVGNQPCHLIADYCSGSTEIWINGEQIKSYSSLHGYIQDPVFFNDKFYFGGPALEEPWAAHSLIEYDGETLKTITEYPDVFVHPTFLNVYQGQLVFRWQDEAAGNELWKSDGTVAGTQLLADISPGFKNSNPEQFTVLDDGLYFSVLAHLDGSINNGYGIWKIENGETNPIVTFPLFFNPEIDQIHKVNDHLIFVAKTNDFGREIWKAPAATTTAIFSPQTVEELDIFPNPVRDFLTIKNIPPFVGKTNLQIFDVQGRLQSNMETSQKDHYLINVDHLTAGVYFVNLNAAGKTYRQKFIKE